MRSARQGRRLLQAIAAVAPHIQHDRTALTQLLTAVLERLTSEVNETALYRPPATSSATAGSDEAVRRWCVRQSKLLHVTCSLSPAFSHGDAPSLLPLIHRQAKACVETAVHLLDRMQGQRGEAVEKGMTVVQLMAAVLDVHEVWQETPVDRGIPAQLLDDVLRHTRPTGDAAEVSHLRRQWRTLLDLL